MKVEGYNGAHGYQRPLPLKTVRGGHTGTPQLLLSTGWSICVYEGWGLLSALILTYPHGTLSYPLSSDRQTTVHSTLSFVENPLPTGDTWSLMSMYGGAAKPVVKLTPEYMKACDTFCSTCGLLDFFLNINTFVTNLYKQVDAPNYFWEKGLHHNYNFHDLYEATDRALHSDRHSSKLAQSHIGAGLFPSIPLGQKIVLPFAMWHLSFHKGGRPLVYQIHLTSQNTYPRQLPR